MKLSVKELTDLLAKFSYSKSMGNLPYEWDWESERVKNEYKEAMQPYAEFITEKLTHSNSFYSDDITLLIRALCVFSSFNILMFIGGTISGEIKHIVFIIAYGIFSLVLAAASFLLLACRTAEGRTRFD